ncbi:unnamed protein product [Coffea canephora]|uniref:tRNA-binding domain-containing protein n=1 Tax=Coffea canephora TaxID=49390 RepID=A0A068VEC9_COFCA|nr:unnamed protein product [Coffea canephora]
MGLGGSMSLLRGGSSSSSGYCCCSSSSSNYGYGRRSRPVLLRALLPSATASATSSSTPPPLQPLLLLLRPRDRKKTIIPTTPFSTSPPAKPNYYASSWAATEKLTPPILPPSPVITKFTPATASPTLLPGWKRCFCTAPSSHSSVKVEDDDDDEMTKIKEAANSLDIRVGKILKAWRHQEADSLYVEEVDVGEPEPRIICSGLVKYLPLHHLQGINVVVLANLKPRNMRGVKSSGMLMAASDASHENVELLVPPEGSVPGQRIWFGSVDEKESLPDAASPNQANSQTLIA